MASTEFRQTLIQHSLVACDGVALQLLLVQQWIERREQQQREETRRRPGVPTTLTEVHRGGFEVHRILFEDEHYCLRTTRLRQATLVALIDTLQEQYGLEDTRISAAEKVITFLDYCANKKTFREMRRVYQHSYLSFTRHLTTMLRCLCRMFKNTAPNPSLGEPHFDVRNTDDNRNRYFNKCIGALDGTHIPISMRGASEHGAWRNPKGWPSQNVLFVCDFDLNIVFVQPGYEGSATDETVLGRAIQNGFHVPPTHYYLGDGGYSEENRMLLVPYQGVRYHLREQADASSQPSTKEELFNLRHARLRNCVERLNDVLKKRWRIIRDGPGQGSTIKKQVLFVWAISAVHNFINQHGQAEDEDDFLRELPDNPTVDDQDEGGAAQNNGGAAQDDQPEVLSDNEMVRFRDTLAREMWENLLIEDS